MQQRLIIVIKYSNNYIFPNCNGKKYQNTKLLLSVEQAFNIELLKPGNQRHIYN